MTTTLRLPAYTKARLTESKQRVAALQLLTDESVLDGLASLWEGMREPSSNGHSLPFVTWVLEAATKTADPNAARAFAMSYLDRPFSYSTTPAGLSALMFEAWLFRKAGSLFKAFVETVVDTNGQTYCAVFEGQLNERDYARLKTQTAEHVKEWKVMVAAGAQNADNMISDLTVLEATANPKLKKTDYEQSIAKDEPAMSDRASVDSKSMRPESREQYLQLVVEGGLSTAAMRVVFGDEIFENEEPCSRGGQQVRDHRDVTWTRTGSADRWMPRLIDRSSLRETGGPPGLRTAPKGTWQSCNTCAHFGHPIDNGDRGECELFGVPVRAGQVCDEWDGHETGQDESSDRFRIRIVPRDEEPVMEDLGFDGREDIAFATDEVMRSKIGSWAVFEDDDGVPVIVAERSAWLMPKCSLEQVRVLVKHFAEGYRYDAPWVIDRGVEHALAEFAREEGQAVANVAECVAFARPDEDGVRNRNHLIETHYHVQEADDEKEEKPKGDKEEKGDEGPPVPPPPPPPTDRMDEPEFYRQDLQTYYDTQLLSGVSPKKAEQKTRQRFDVKELVVTPTGEVRSPGVVDRPEPPAPPVGGEAPAPPPAPLEQPDGAPDSATGAAPASEAATALPEVAAVVRSWAKKSGKTPEEAERLWLKAGSLATSNYPDLTPESSKWYAVKMGIFRRMMGIAAEDAVEPPATVDEAFSRWLLLDDDVNFDAWLADTHPQFLPHLALWLPRDLHEAQREPKVTPEQAVRYDRWRRLLNMNAQDIRVMIRRVGEATTTMSTGGLRAFVLGRRSTRRLLSMRMRPAEQWTAEDWNWAGRQANTVARLRSMHGPLMKEGRPTEKLLLLRAWGHEPRVRSQVHEGDVMVGCRVNWRCTSCKALVTESSFNYNASTGLWTHSCGAKLVVPRADEDKRRLVNREVIDLTPGALPCLISERGVTPPSFPDLRTGKQTMTESDTAVVMKARAVKHTPPKNKPVPAVWRSVVDGVEWFVSNSHRAYAASRTLSEAVVRFHAVIKETV